MEVYGDRKKLLRTKRERGADNEMNGSIYSREIENDTQPQWWLPGSNGQAHEWPVSLALSPYIRP